MLHGRTGSDHHALTDGPGCCQRVPTRLLVILSDWEEGGEAIAGLGDDKAAVLAEGADERRKRGAHDLGEHFGAVLAVLHQRVGHRREAGDVDKQADRREGASCMTSGVVPQDEIRHKAMDMQSPDGRVCCCVEVGNRRSFQSISQPQWYVYDTVLLTIRLHMRHAIGEVCRIGSGSPLWLF